MRERRSQDSERLNMGGGSVFFFVQEGSVFPERKLNIGDVMSDLIEGDVRMVT